MDQKREKRMAHRSIFCIKISFFIILLACIGCSSTKELSPKEKKAEIFYNYGTNNLVKKQYTEALNNLLKAAKLSPSDTKIHNNLGMAYFFKSQYNLAQKHLRKALTLDPKNSDARNNLASVYYHIKAYKLAKKEYLIVKEDLVYKHQYRTYFNLALISLKENNIEEAKKYLHLSIHEKADYCSAHFQLGMISEKEYRFQQAYDSFIEASKGTCVNQPASHYRQALMLIEMEEFEQARNKLFSIIDNFPKTQYPALARVEINKLKNKIRKSMVKKSTMSHPFSN